MLVPIPALNDNYIWLYGRENCAKLVVDISDFAPLQNYLTKHPMELEAVLLTHNHADHVGGVASFKQTYPYVKIYGSAECADYVDQVINEGVIHTSHYQIQVIPTGGHTSQHVSYVVDGHLFCGDTLFSAGCGRVFTGNYVQMLESLQRLNQLPAETLICPAHEYTLANLTFAQTVLTDKSAVENQKIIVEQQRTQNLPSVPTTLALERKINPFLQAKNLAQFMAWRQAKDQF